MLNEDCEIYFKNREVAAYRLLDILPIDMMKLENWTLIATSLGGFKIAKIIAESLDANIDIMFSHKIFAPNNEECEIAVVTEYKEVLIHEELLNSFEISLDYVYTKSKQVHEEYLSQMVYKFRHGKSIEELANKNVLLIDEGINTGLTMMACIKTVINLNVKSVSVAIPIIPTASINVIETIADDLFYIKDLKHFTSIDFYYESLEEITIEDIKN